MVKNVHEQKPLSLHNGHIPLDMCVYICTCAYVVGVQLCMLLFVDSVRNVECTGKSSVWYGCDWSGNLHVHVWVCINGVGVVI